MKMFRLFYMLSIWVVQSTLLPDIAFCQDEDEMDPLLTLAPQRAQRYHESQSQIPSHRPCELCQKPMTRESNSTRSTELAHELLRDYFSVDYSDPLVQELGGGMVAYNKDKERRRIIQSRCVTCILKSFPQPISTTPSPSPSFSFHHHSVEDIEELLINKRRNPRIGIDMHDLHLETPLHYVCMINNKDLAKQLIELGANLNSRTREGNTPLHISAGLQDNEITQMLIENRAPIEARNARKETPLHIACLRQSYTNSQLLIEYGANVEVKTQCSEDTPLHYACKSGSLAIAELLISANFDLINQVNKSRDAPIHIACKGKHNLIVGLLLSNSPHIIESENFYRQTPLHLSSILGDIPSMRILLESGAQVNATARNKFTALKYAHNARQMDVVTLLTQASTDPTHKSAQPKRKIELTAASAENRAEQVEIEPKHVKAFASAHEESWEVVRSKKEKRSISEKGSMSTKLKKTDKKRSKK